MCRLLWSLCLGLLLGTVLSPPLSTAEPVGGTDRPAELSWHTDYGEAIKAAMQERKLLLIVFQGKRGKLPARLESAALADPQCAKKLQDMVRVRLPLDTKIRVQGEELKLLEHNAFSELRGGAGVVVLDYVDEDHPNYGCPVVAFPLAGKPRPTVRQMLGLPEVSIQVPEAAVEPSVAPSERLTWYCDYAKATGVARRQGKMLLIVFSDEEEPSRRFEAETLADPKVVEKLKNVVRVKLRTEATISVQGKEVALLEHASFAEMLGRPGVAILDFSHRDTPQYGAVVSTFPLRQETMYNVRQMLVILDLPPGTLTQRTLIYAVRTHPERPASTEGRRDPYLVKEAESHARYQARIRRQGHHSWETRFHRINAKLPDGLTASEVCAESWPGQGLLEAALDCVRCWRYSSGHWAAVCKPHRCYGYDMQRGSNGIWYATGIFGQR